VLKLAYKIDDLEEPHDDLAGPAPLQNFQTCKHPVC
jgi:hypothetical protein